MEENQDQKKEIQIPMVKLHSAIMWIALFAGMYLLLMTKRNEFGQIQIYNLIGGTIGIGFFILHAVKLSMYTLTEIILKFNTIESDTTRKFMEAGFDRISAEITVKNALRNLERFMNDKLPDLDINFDDKQIETNNNEEKQTEENNGEDSNGS
jgi:hypothetical protein